MSRSVRGPDYSLRIYPKHPIAEAYKVGGSFTPYAIVAADKRLTDGELAAEYWRSTPKTYREYTMADGATEFVLERDILKRFATLPHFDE